MKSINIETLMGHSIGISHSYYRATEKELFEDYLNAVDHLTISIEYSLEKEISSVLVKSDGNYNSLKVELYAKENEIIQLREKGEENEDAIAILSDQVMQLVKEIDKLKQRK